MKRIYTLSGVFLLALIAIAFVYSAKQNQKQPKIKDDEGPDNPFALEQYMHMRYADPYTGTIPFGAAYKAYMQLVARGLIKPHMNVSRSGSNSNVWQLINDFFPSIAVSRITYDPQQTNTFYFCTGEGWYGQDMAIGNGVFKSTDGGANWAQLSATDTAIFDYCQDIKVHPTTGDVYVATKSNGLMRSKDGGTTWHKVLGTAPYQAIDNSMCNIAFTKNGGIFCTTGIFQPGALYYSDSGDSGTWVRNANGFPTSGIYRVQIATAPSDDNVAYAIACNTTTYSIKGFYKTVNKGVTWTTLPNPGGDLNFAKVQAWYDLALAVDPNNQNVVAAGGWELWRSTNGGQNWQQLADGQPDSSTGQYVHVDQHEIQFIGSDTVLFGNDGGIWESTDFTDANPVIFSRNYGYRVTQFYQADINPLAGNPFICGGTQDNGSPAMPNSGISTYYDISWADGAYCAINYNNPNIVYTNKNQNGTYRTINGVRDTITNPYLLISDVLFVNPMEMDPNNPELLYQASSIGLYRLNNASTAKDSDWTRATKGIGSISAIAISKSQPNTLFLGYSTTGEVFKVINADTTGKNYAPINCDSSKMLPIGNAGAPLYVGSIQVDPTNVNHVFVVYANYGVKHIWETHNALAARPTWSNQDGDLPNLPVNDVFNNPGDTSICYAATDLGVFYTTKLNGANTHWLPSNQGLANVRVYMFKYRASDSSIIAATHGRGIFQSKVNETNTGSYELVWNERGPLNVGGRTRTLMVDPNDPTHHKIWAGSVAGGVWVVNNIDSLPVTLGINTIAAIPQASFKTYPNPFNDLVHFVFSADDNTNNKVLRIFDVNGRVVENINLASRTQYDWQPANGVVPGLYFAELISGDKKYVQKIMYLR